LAVPLLQAALVVRKKPDVYVAKTCTDPATRWILLLFHPGGWWAGCLGTYKAREDKSSISRAQCLAQQWLHTWPLHKIGLMQVDSPWPRSYQQSHTCRADVSHSGSTAPECNIRPGEFTHPCPHLPHSSLLPALHLAGCSGGKAKWPSEEGDMPEVLCCSLQEGD
jgi:hypothetical protein